MSQLTQPDEKGQLRTKNAIADNSEFGVDEIRQVQMLMILFSCLPPDGKLCEVLEKALALPHKPCLSRISPPTDMSFHGLKTWLESCWVQEGLTPDEQKLVDWQRSGESMVAAVQELKEAEQKIGMKLGIQRMS